MLDLKCTLSFKLLGKGGCKGEKMYKWLRLVRNCAALLVLVFSVVAFCGRFYPVYFFDVEGVALMQRVLLHIGAGALALLAVLGVLTLLFGRIFCSCLCPFGLYQEALLLVLRKKFAYRANHSLKYFIAAVAFGFLIGGSALVIRFIDPYTLFGAAMSGAWLGLGAFAVVAVLTFFKGRLFCTDICPLGTVLGVLSNYALFNIYIDADKCKVCGRCAKVCSAACIDFKNRFVNNEPCVKCLKCLKVCPFNAMRYGRKKAAPIPYDAARRRLLIGAASGLVLVGAVKSGIVWVQKTAEKFKNIIVPPGAQSAADFANRCLNCNLCVQNCPMKILKKATADYPVVHTEYGDNFCSYNCHKCASICPSGALKKLSLEVKRRTKIATAVVDENACVKCGLCVAECPRACITKEDGKAPVIPYEKCIGCGACQAVCPVKAISMQAVEKQFLIEETNQSNKGETK